MDHPVEWRYMNVFYVPTAVDPTVREVCYCYALSGVPRYNSRAGRLMVRILERLQIFPTIVGLRITRAKRNWLGASRQIARCVLLRDTYTFPVTCDAPCDLRSDTVMNVFVVIYIIVGIGFVRNIDNFNIFGHFWWFAVSEQSLVEQLKWYSQTLTTSFLFVSYCSDFNYYIMFIVCVFFNVMLSQCVVQTIWLLLLFVKYHFIFYVIGVRRPTIRPASYDAENVFLIAVNYYIIILYFNSS